MTVQMSPRNLRPPAERIPASTTDLDTLLSEQAAYYRARASEYDEVYAGRTKRFTLAENAWPRSTPEAARWLELACGTGHWTPLLAPQAQSVTAVDAAPEMIAIARERVKGRNSQELWTALPD